jgi:GTP pyrophosphokinase
MRSEFAKLLKLVRKTIPDLDEDRIRKAYRVANEAHKGQVRLSGEPFVSHCIAVAYNLAQIGLDETTIAAGLLHDVIEDTDISFAEVEAEFDTQIAELVEGVTKIGALSFSPDASTQEEKQARNLQKMLIATAQDVRVVLIKLADRLHNMRTIEFLPREKVLAISRETMDIYAPLAHRLGIARWRWELEDHAFHQMNPMEYRDMAKAVSMKRREREVWLRKTTKFLEKHLEEAEVNCTVIGRPKHLYSIYQKMTEQGKTFDQVMDVVAVRIVTQTVSGCYNALGVVHHLWPPLPNRFKDYIAMPKANMYQSIHTSVMGENAQALEVQIRTAEMDRVAREGIAAHWKYKSDDASNDPKLNEQLGWLRQMYEWLEDAHAPDELLDSLRRDVGTSGVYVFTPKGEVKELPVGATPLDFAYLIHSDVGHQCIGARVNGRMVPLRYNLQTGDVVEILSSKNQHPHQDWLEFVVTGKARTRIRHRLRELGDMEPLDTQIRRPIVEPPRKPRRQRKSVQSTNPEKLIRIQGEGGMQVQFAKCCSPIPGQPVIGYVTKNPGITIHRSDCRAFVATHRDPKRILEASWVGQEELEFALRVTTGQRPNILADITNALRPMNISIVRADYRPGEDGKSFFEFVFTTHDQDAIVRVAATVRTVAGVTHVQHVAAAALESSAV